MANSRSIKFQLIGYSPAGLLMLISRLGERELLALSLEKEAECLFFMQSSNKFSIRNKISYYITCQKQVKMTRQIGIRELAGFELEIT